MALISRIKTFSDGEILTADDLNAEFNNVVDGVNSISNDNIASNAAISPTKISASIAGSAITRNSGTGALSVNADGVTIENISGSIRVKDDGITTAKIDDEAVTTAKIDDEAVTTAKIDDGAVTQAKRAALGQQVSSSSASYSTTSTSVVDVTNLTVTITTTGRPVKLQLIDDGSGNSSSIEVRRADTSANCFIYIFRDSTQLCRNLLQIVSIGSTDARLAVPSSTVSFVDTPSAGTYTYKISTNAIVSGTTVSFSNVKLIAYEL